MCHEKSYPTVGSNELHSFVKTYVNVVNSISTFVKLAPPTNTIANNTILTQYSINKWLKVFGEKGEAALQKKL